MALVQNSNSIARIIVRELRSGNRLHKCDGCGNEAVTQYVMASALCQSCRILPQTEKGS